MKGHQCAVSYCARPQSKHIVAASENYTVWANEQTLQKKKNVVIISGYLQWGPMSFAIIPQETVQ